MASGVWTEQVTVHIKQGQLKWNALHLEAFSKICRI